MFILLILLFFYVYLFLFYVFLFIVYFILFLLFILCYFYLHHFTFSYLFFKPAHCRVFANGLGDLGSIPGHVIPKTLKMVPPCLTLSNITYVSRVKWSNPRKGVALSPTLRCSSYWKRSLRVVLDYGRQLYFFHLLLNILFYFIIHFMLFLFISFYVFLFIFLFLFLLFIVSWFIWFIFTFSIYFLFFSSFIFVLLNFVYLSIPFLFIVFSVILI